MNTQHQNVAPGGTVDVEKTIDATEDFTSDTQDVYSAWVAAYTVKLTGTTSPDLTLTMQGSAAVPPTGYASATDYKVPDDSWEQVYSGGLAVQRDATADGSWTIAADVSGLMFRWLRLVITVNTPGGGRALPVFFSK